MIIQQKRIRNLGRHLPQSFQGQELRIGIAHTPQDNARLSQAGFTPALAFGEVVLPSGVGPVTRFNANGKYKVRRDLPMETAYRQIIWTYYQRHGTEKVEVTEVKDVPYQRYPRDYIAPPSVMLEVVQAPDGHRLIVATGTLRYNDTGSDRLLHAINVILELFGRCEVFTTDLVSVIPPAQQCQLNWRILPQGQYPWEKVKQDLEPIIKGATPGNQAVIQMRLQTVSGYAPDFVAIGTA